MDSLPDNWPALLLAGVLLILLVIRLIVALPIFRPAPRHSGERTIRVVGVGGAGGNAINHMIRSKQRGVDYIAVNTDAQVLGDSLAPHQVQIGEQLTQGLGAGGDPTIGRLAAEEDAEAVGRALVGSDLVFIAAGLGGGTGSGAAPVIAAQARAAGALTVGVVTKPFSFEGVTRRRIADAAAEELIAEVDTLLLIENDRVSQLINDDTSMLDAFAVVNEVLGQTVRAVVDIMTVPGLINLDFADVRTIMRDGGTALTGIGWSAGENRAIEAARQAIANPLLDHDIRGARAILLNVAGASGMTMREVADAAEKVRSAADPEATIIFGAIFDDRLRDDIRVTVIATRFQSGPPGRPVHAGSPAEPAAEATADIADPAIQAPEPAEGAEPAGDGELDRVAEPAELEPRPSEAEDAGNALEPKPAGATKRTSRRRWPAPEPSDRIRELAVPADGTA